MFSGWRIAKSVEEMVSRWALKRVCKFFLKKKLGQFILGDIDLDQLDVQLTDGSIQLSDLALNVDYLNQKFGSATSVIIKEGSIGSLLVKMPWKGKGCQVELDELELVLAPCRDTNLRATDESCSTSQDGNHSMQSDLGQFEHDVLGNPSKFTSNDVHEGVKIIAKMVKWILTSFHVKIKKLIVVFDPCIEKDENKVESRATLVLRISEIECGTCVSEDSTSYSDAKAESFFGISRLTNFVRFQGAVLELLHTDAVDQQTSSPCASATPFSIVPSGCSPSNVTTPIMTWNGGGFSGNIKLSIPWKDGSLDIRKVDADVSIDPIELRFQPITLKWFLLSWETYKKFDKDQRAHMLNKPTDSVYFNTSSHFHSSPNVSAVIATDEIRAIRGSSSSNFSSLNEQESISETMLPASHLIVDWVPFPVSGNQKDGIQDADLGASVDQFFECFDGMRHSQSALGSSGMWNWTCSVFSAITAASSLASGSLHVPSEQQHVQTNLKANFAGISIVFSFYDEEQKHLCDLNGNQMNGGSCVHYLGAECRGIFLVVQVCPEKMSFEGTLKYIEVADYFYKEIDAVDFHLREFTENIDSQTVSIQHLQAEVQGVLPPFAQSGEVHDSDEFNGPISAHYSFGNKRDAVKILLLRTSGTTNCLFTVGANRSRGSLKRTTSFSLKLPPFILWVNFHLINMLWDLSHEVGNSTKMNHEKTGFSPEMVDAKHASSHGEVKTGSCPPITTLSSTETLRGDISAPDARVILCFPFDSGKDTQGYCSWDQFIALNFSSPSSFKKGVVQEHSAVSDGSFQEQLSSTAIRSLHWSIGDLDIYMVISTCKDKIGINYGSTQSCKFSAQKILSVSNRTALLSVISMLWQEGPVTGPWIAERAKFLATFEESRSRKHSMGKDSEFATVNHVNYVEDKNSQIRQEIILSSAFFVGVRMFPVTINLDSSQFSGLLELLNQISSGLSCVAHDDEGSSEESSVSQTSILVECDSLEFLIRPDSKENLKSSMQSELSGSWNCLKLRIQNFNLLSVSNIGGIENAGFFWLAHGEGMLWGCVSEVPNQDFLLISCSNSTMKRGDGGGSNALSSRLAGSDIVHLFEPETSRGLTSVTVRCSTIVAVGGRLDWFDAIISFFRFPSAEVEEAVDSGLHKEDLTVPCRASFVLNLVDIGLSYEPYCMNLMGSDETNGPCVACILAASSLILSNTTVVNSIENDYEIRVQDLGLLLSVVSEPEKLCGTYSVQHLHDIGYIKVAREAHLEAVLRTNCKNGLLWELECSNSHIYVETCHDATSGLISLVAQLQQLFVPDIEESLVHLQDRYDSVQQEQERNDFVDVSGILNSDSSPPSQMHTSTADTKSKARVVGLMDEISEDAFHLDGSQTCQFDSSESQFCISPDDAVLGEPACSLSVESPEIFSTNLSVNGSVPLIGLQSSQTSLKQNGCLPEFIEGYCLGDLRPLSELSVGRHSGAQMLKCRPRNMKDGDLEKGNGGWYGDACLRVVENHLSETNGKTSGKKLLECKLPSMDSAGADDFVKAMGRVLLGNINVTWRMYGGSDWHESRNNGEHTSNMHGRDMTACLELALSGMQFQYNIFPISDMFVSKLSLSIQDFHLYDRSRDAPWKLVLGYYDSKDHPRQSFSKAFKLDLEVVRPNPLTPLEEYRLRVAMLPVLLHLHQSQLDFLIYFFGAKSSSEDQSPGCHKDSCDSKLSTTKRKNLAGHTIAEEALLPYFQFDVWPVIVRVDYSPSRVDLAALRGGNYVELVNLVPWKGVELKLKHVHAVGIYGWGGVCETIVGEWLEDISQNQIHKVLQGLPTIRSLVAVGSGAAKLVSMPVESYRKDKRVLKGMQRGTVAFLRSISLEAVGLGVHLAAGAHDILLQAEYILTSIPPSVSWPVQDNAKANIRCNQPKDAQQGIHKAYESLSDGLGRSASALVRTPLKKYQRGASAGSALATAVRGVPAAAIAPASACASAVHYALLGLRNSLDPEHKKESMEKYLGPTQSRE
ncbi:autophagy-related protein 2-like [Melia azedarach]|uniref:Autophagy-related protein 2-like n=1 Tax=Melia azedarach TaxID=155640 RepID=A0ACC1XYJ2_MELAZ|nr:autophagy-related protein 2-like [Melia azedarach]